MPTYATLPPRRPETVWSCRERRGRRCPLDPGFAVDEFFQGEERRRAWVRWSGFIVAFWRAWFTTSGDTNIGAKGGVSNQVEPPHSDTVRESQEFPEFWLAGLECANLGTYTYVHLRTLTYTYREADRKLATAWACLGGSHVWKPAMQGGACGPRVLVYKHRSTGASPGGDEAGGGTTPLVLN